MAISLFPAEVKVPLAVPPDPLPVLVTVRVKFDPDKVVDPVPLFSPETGFPLKLSPPELESVICASKEFEPLFIEQPVAGVGEHPV